MPDEMPLNVQEIMSQIEQQLWTEKDDQGSLWMPDLDPQLRAYLVRLREMAGSLQVEPVVQQDSLPFVGWLITWWRAQIHQLVLFYINSLMRQQVGFEQAATRTIIYLAEHLNAENKALRAQVNELRRELTQVRATVGNERE